MATLEEMMSGQMMGEGMGSPIPQGPIPEEPQGMTLPPELDAMFQQALQGDSTAMANFILSITRGM